MSNIYECKFCEGTGLTDEHGDPVYMEQDNLRERMQEWIEDVIAMARVPVGQQGGPPPSDSELAEYAMTHRIVREIESLKRDLTNPQD